MNSTVLRFDGGAIPTGGGASSDRAIHHLFLRELTITELGQEVSVYALLDLDRPTLVAPNYEPVSAFTLYDWCSSGDVLQVDVAEALETGTNTYSAFFESANVATSNDGSYIEECVIRVDTKLSGATPQIKTRYLSLSQKVDESTSAVYLCQLTSVDDHVYYPDFKVKITGLSTEQAGLLPIKIRGDGETIGIEVVHQNALGDPIDPFLRVKSLNGVQTPIDYTADVMYSPNIKVNSLGQTVLVQKGRPNRLVAKYFSTEPSNPGYIVNATEISNGYVEIEMALPSFTLNGATVTPQFLNSSKYKFLTTIEGLDTDEYGLAEFRKIEVILRMESDHTHDYIIAVATDFSKDEYGRNLSDVAGLEQGRESKYRRTYPKDVINYVIRFTKILVRYHFDLEYAQGIMTYLRPGDGIGHLPGVRVAMDPLENTSYQQEIGNV